MEKHDTHFLAQLAPSYDHMAEHSSAAGRISGPGFTFGAASAAERLLCWRVPLHLRGRLWTELLGAGCAAEITDLLLLDATRTKHTVLAKFEEPRFIHTYLRGQSLHAALATAQGGGSTGSAAAVSGSVSRAEGAAEAEVEASSTPLQSLVFELPRYQLEFELRGDVQLQQQQQQGGHGGQQQGLVKEEQQEEVVQLEQVQQQEKGGEQQQGGQGGQQQEEGKQQEQALDGQVQQLKLEPQDDRGKDWEGEQVNRSSNGAATAVSGGDSLVAANRLTLVSANYSGYELAPSQQLVRPCTSTPGGALWTLPEFSQYLVLRQGEGRRLEVGLDKAQQLVLVPSGAVKVDRGGAVAAGCGVTVEVPTESGAELKVRGARGAWGV